MRFGKDQGSIEARDNDHTVLVAENNESQDAIAKEHPAITLLRERFATLQSHMRLRRIVTSLLTLFAIGTWAQMYLTLWKPVLGAVQGASVSKISNATLWTAGEILIAYAVLLLVVYVIIDQLLINRDKSDVEIELESCRKRLIEPLGNEVAAKIGE